MSVSVGGTLHRSLGGERVLVTESVIPYCYYYRQVVMVAFSDFSSFLWYSFWRFAPNSPNVCVCVCYHSDDRDVLFHCEDYESYSVEHPAWVCAL